MQVDGPLRDAGQLNALQPLRQALHAHHLRVSEYPHLVRDDRVSWERRPAWYTQLLAEGAAFFVARNDGRPVGYALAHTTPGPDDTFDVRGGIVEVVSLVVEEAARGSGVGTALMSAARDFATAQHVDTLKVAVMVGNTRARSIRTPASRPPKKSCTSKLTNALHDLGLGGPARHSTRRFGTEAPSRNILDGESGVVGEQRGRASTSVQFACRAPFISKACGSAKQLLVARQKWSREYGGSAMTRALRRATRAHAKTLTLTTGGLSMRSRRMMAVVERLDFASSGATPSDPSNAGPGERSLRA